MSFNFYFFYRDENQNWPKLQGRKSYLSLRYLIMLHSSDWIRTQELWINCKIFMTFLSTCHSYIYTLFQHWNQKIYSLYLILIAAIELRVVLKKKISWVDLIVKLLSFTITTLLILILVGRVVKLSGMQ